MSTHDEDFARRLRARVDRVAPEVAVDTDAVLPRARRRRLARVGGTGLASVGAVALAAGVVVAAPWEQPAEVAPAGRVLSLDPDDVVDPGDGVEPEPLAVLDEETGEIRMPIDEWTWTLEEEAVSMTAVEHYRVGCLVDAGYEATFAGPVSVAFSRPESLYGVWRMAEVEAGYERFAISDHQGAQWDRSAVPWEVVVACTAEAREQGLAYDPEDFESGPVVWRHSVGTPEGQAIRRAWLACLREHGENAREDEPALFPIGGLSEEPLKEQVRIARIDVGCKQDLGTVQALADLDAQAQLEHIERAQDDLVDLRAAQDAALATSLEYLAEHGVEMP